MKTDERTPKDIGDLANTDTPSQLELDIQVPGDKQPPHSRPSVFSKKSPWPIAILVMLVIAGLFGWRLYNNSQSPTVSEPETASTAKLPVRAVRAQLAPIRRWVTSPDGDVRAERYKQLILNPVGSHPARQNQWPLPARRRSRG